MPSGYNDGDGCARCRKRVTLSVFDSLTGEICGECATHLIEHLRGEIKRTRDRYDGLLGDREKPAPKREVDA